MVRSRLILLITLTLLSFTACKKETAPQRSVHSWNMTSLVDETGAAVALKSIERPKVVFFGYSHCPDMCPAALSQLAKAVKILGRDGNRITPVFISLDPSRDTPETLSAYRDQFDERKLRAFTGDRDQIDRLAKDFGVMYKQSENAAVGYGIDHTGFYYLLNDGDGLLLALPVGLNAVDLAQQMRETLL